MSRSSGRNLFIRLDSRELERYTKQEIQRHRRIPMVKVRQLERLRRSLQSIPPRELQIVYLIKVQRIEQDEVCRLFKVRQSNISYRLDRARYRIKLHEYLSSITSETKVRNQLALLGLNEHAIEVVCGVIKTSSQSATSAAYGINQGNARLIVTGAIEQLSRVAGHYKDLPAEIENLKEQLSRLSPNGTRKEVEDFKLLTKALAVKSTEYATAQRIHLGDPTGEVLYLITEVERHYNHLRAIKTQGRWTHKVRHIGGGNYPNYDGADVL